MFWGTFNVKVHFVMVQTIIKINSVKELDTMINQNSKCNFETYTQNNNFFFKTRTDFCPGQS